MAELQVYVIVIPEIQQLDVTQKHVKQNYDFKLPIHGIDRINFDVLCSFSRPYVIITGFCG
jgi:hypothetical protein